MNYYVTMTDVFMSGKGEAEGKLNKLVFECDTLQQAETVEENARMRGDMSYIRLGRTKPRFDPDRFYVQVKTIKDYPSWYERNYFSHARVWTA